MNQNKYQKYHMAWGTRTQIHPSNKKPTSECHLPLGRIHIPVRPPRPLPLPPGQIFSRSENLAKIGQEPPVDGFGKFTLWEI